jgi:hypothetical protein
MLLNYDFISELSIDEVRALMIQSLPQEPHQLPNKSLINDPLVGVDSYAKKKKQNPRKDSLLIPQYDRLYANFFY